MRLFSKGRAALAALAGMPPFSLSLSISLIIHIVLLFFVRVNGASQDVRLIGFAGDVAADYGDMFLVAPVDVLPGSVTDLYEAADMTDVADPVAAADPVAEMEYKPEEPVSEPEIEREPDNPPVMEDEPEISTAKAETEPDRVEEATESVIDAVAGNKAEVEEIPRVEAAIEDAMEREAAVIEPQRIETVAEQAEGKDRPVEKPIEQPVEKPVGKPVDKPVHKQGATAEQPSDAIPKKTVSARDEGPISPEGNPERIDLTGGAVGHVEFPKVISGGKPVYPESLRRRGIEGRVKLRIVVDKTGKVTELRVEESSGFSQFDRSAMEAIGASKFRPALKDGKPVESVSFINVIFKLE